MLFGLLGLIGCGAEVGEAEIAEPELTTLFVEVAARVGEVGSPAGWAARATWTEPPEQRSLQPGECRPAGSARAPAARGPRGAGTLAIAGPTRAALAWDGERGVWTADGPRRALDPAWSVSDVIWTDGSGTHTAEGAVRFAGVPDVTQVTRAREGQVTLSWDPATADEPRVLVSGPGGVLECGVGAGEVTLPWWVVPAYGGEVVLRTSRQESDLVDGVLLRIRTTLERVVPLDRPVWTTAGEVVPVFESYTPHGPRRLLRRARAPVG